jgi:hypothetical protein
MRAPTKDAKEEWLEILGGAIFQAGRSLVGNDDHEVKKSMARSQVLVGSRKALIGLCESIIDSDDKAHANMQSYDTRPSEDCRTLGFRLTSSLPC